MRRKIFQVLILSFLVLPVFGQDPLIRSWKIGAYTVELFEQIPVREDYGIRHPNDRSEQMKSVKVTYYFITKNGVSLSFNGHISVSSDSCQLSFLEYANGRPKTGLVGYKVRLDLCTQQIKTDPVNKPVLTPEKMSNVTIKALDSLIYNPHNVHMPFVVNNYNDGIPTAVHPRELEGLALFLDHASLMGEFKQEEFGGNNQPHFEINWIENGKQRSLLLYWGLFIIDGYVYGDTTPQLEPFSMKIWDANLLLWTQKINHEGK